MDLKWTNIGGRYKSKGGDRSIEIGKLLVYIFNFFFRVELLSSDLYYHLQVTLYLQT